ncbi:hypothetical protein BGZ63DRAFT_348960 [Mariannaea sp. PMI_226]|nr:hypothetical protein BGZ63DRAFT_348960 [Mariannaea sp. PMI_226]
MASFTFKSAIIAMTVALTAATTPQCNTNADCLQGYICGTSDGPGDTPPTNVCVALNTCTNATYSKTFGPKCGDSIFCPVGAYCGGGYYDFDGDRVLGQVCVDPATGLLCAAPST